MRADIDKRTAALFFFIDEHAPGRNGAATDGNRFRIVNVAKHAGFGLLFEVERILTVSVLITDG